MPGNFLRAFIANLRAHKLLSLITVLSLSIGLTVFSMAYLYVERELSYDGGWPNADRILRLTLEQRGMPGSPDGSFTSVNARAWPVLMNYFGSQIEQATRVAWSGVRSEASGGAHPIAFVDADFGQVFQLEVLSGNLEQTLANPSYIALSERGAGWLGQDLQPGSRVTLLSMNAISPGEQEFVVGAIFRVPQPSSLDFDLLAAIPDTPSPLFGSPMLPPWETGVEIWLTLEEGIGTAEFNAQQPAFVQTQITAFNDSLPPSALISEHLFYRFQPLTEMHLNPVGPEVMWGSGNKAKLLTFAAVGLLVLLVGCSNATSLSLAMALNRRREIGIRKACGASKGNVLRQHLGEAVLLALLAYGLALGLQALLLPPVMTLLSIRGDFTVSLVGHALLAIISISAGLLNALYPAFVLSGVRPQHVLRQDGARSPSRALRARTLLVGGQFCLASLFMCGAVTLYAQLAVTRAQPLGFDTSDLLLVSHSTPSHQLGQALRDGLSSLPGVERMAGSWVVPNQNTSPQMNGVVLVRKDAAPTRMQATSVSIDPGFFELMDIPLLAGRFLDAERDRSVTLFSGPGEDSRQSRVPAVLVNRSAVQALGFATPEQALDRLVYRHRSGRDGSLDEVVLQVVGVVEDSMFASLHRRPLPEVYSLNPDEALTNNYLLKYQPGAVRDIHRRVSEVYQNLDVAAPYQSFVKERIGGAFVQERSDSRLLLSAAAIALFLSCVGLYGLAASTMARSVKELGVRKAIGAGTASLVALFLWRFARPILLANLIAWPVAGWFVLRWIQQFPYQLDLAWLPSIFLGASALVLLVAWLTVSWVTAQAALRAPVQSLRYE